MAKYYCLCGSIQEIVSTELTPREVCGRILLSACDEVVLMDEFCIDERGFRSSFTDDKPEHVFVTSDIMEEEGLFDE